MYTYINAPNIQPYILQEPIASLILAIANKHAATAE